MFALHVEYFFLKRKTLKWLKEECFNVIWILDTETGYKWFNLQRPFKVFPTMKIKKQQSFKVIPTK